MAAPAIIRESNTPKNSYSTPAAMEIPMALYPTTQRIDLVP